jgi:hypothetical protein
MRYVNISREGHSYARPTLYILLLMRGEPTIDTVPFEIRKGVYTNRRETINIVGGELIFLAVVLTRLKVQFEANLSG